MTNEIKEILVFLSSENYYIQDIDCKFKRLYLDEVNKLLDYITNLQEENERLKENAEHNDKVVDKARWNEMIYKSRNEKAIEYIDNIIRLQEITNGILTPTRYTDIKNILKGDDNESNN